MIEMLKNLVMFMYDAVVTWLIASENVDRPEKAKKEVQYVVVENLERIGQLEKEIFRLKLELEIEKIDSEKYKKIVIGERLKHIYMNKNKPKNVREAIHTRNVLCHPLW